MSVNEFVPIIREGRVAKRILLNGNQGCGKSEVQRQLLRAYLKKYPRALIICVQHDEWEQYNVPENACATAKDFNYTGAAYTIFNEKTTFKNISAWFHNGVILFDDCRTYLGNNLDNDQDLKAIMLRTRHKMADLFFTTHGWADIPPKLLMVITDYIIFKCEDSPIIRKEKLSGKLEALITAQNEVNTVVNKAIEKIDSYGVSPSELAKYKQEKYYFKRISF